jgi:hypothetical protein
LQFILDFGRIYRIRKKEITNSYNRASCPRAVGDDWLKTIRSENVWLRLASMWILGLTILLLTWIFSFRALPESVARGSAGVYYVPVKAENVMATFARIFLWNLIVSCIPVALGNLVRVKGVPLGYALTYYHWGMYGVLLGTNSFVIPGPARLLPSLVTLFYGSGIYEISSYTLISAATFNLHDRYGDSEEDSVLARKGKWNLVRLSKTELAVLVFAILMLAVSNYYEALNIFHT